ncbi:MULTISPECIES: crotonase/enoyl-CoA hydratase family protein [unclassified Pseudomonas]|uniref:crotonase/enoyl-CoA hydratase family protein n=1 Tax=unclassified Pseudomonas TaxID=196821 RepID=UPI00244D3DD2|nr:MULTISPECIES: crotonase/enoyl-CoA hydratase family protein [unclassified Pseudomonas]MDG9928178.1 crotonase/enoyl-CoA hydratase family protein [Pseudomonas sp. GD04042]MDH0481258.1 crotonase/enoyl-CoA hydratase family protein [Pseudomonas sp. GD04015]MDH0605165.1 crotonase/enoyl-CoA hydratase family protein [Pseudomonas sp. GD03869]
MSEEKKVGEVRMVVADHIAVISVDNAAKLNAFSPEMIEQLAGHLTTVNNDDDIWVAVLCPEGEHTTAGLDMPKFFGPTATAKPLPEGWVDPFGLHHRCTKPVISVVHGKTYTVGIEMMLAGDIVIAADTATFCQMESKRGIAPLGGAHFRYLTRTGWGNAMYHLFLCDEFDARRALEIGFVQEVHPFGKHKERAMEIARLICKNAPIGLRAAKAAALKYLQEGEQAAIDCIPQIQKTCFASEDFMEGLRSFAERRPAVFKGR